MKYEHPKTCTETACMKRPVITDSASGEVVCGSCGLVLSEKSEYANAGNVSNNQVHEVKNRSGNTSMAMYDYGLFTRIDFKNKDASGKALSTDMRNRFIRLRTWDARSQLEHSDRNMKFSFSLLDALKANLSIPDMVIERAAQMYRKAIAKK